jgi:acetyl-CoA synthetase
VMEVAVVPSPDPVRLAVPKAFVILRPGAEAGPALAQDIFHFSRRTLAPYKRIRRLEFVQELPKTVSGKIRRVQLRTDEGQRVALGERTPGSFQEDDFPATAQD